MIKAFHLQYLSFLTSCKQLERQNIETYGRVTIVTLVEHS